MSKSIAGSEGVIELVERQEEIDKRKLESLNRECFLVPFLSPWPGRVIVSRDAPAKQESKLALPRSLRKEKEMLPTTGHVIKETLPNDIETGLQQPTLIGKRILFSRMSGTAICFKGYPTWIQLELSEILAIVEKEDIQLEEETLEPMV